MSVKSTFSISRETAQKVLMSKIFTLTNEQLAEAIEALPESTYRNYRVYDVLYEEDKEREIRQISEFDWK